MGIDSINEKQKEVKQKMINELLESFSSNLIKSGKLFDTQSMVNLTFSILIMFNREVLIGSIQSFNLQSSRKQLMKDLFGQIKDEVNNAIKRSMV